MKFAEEIAQHVKLFMYHPELAKRNSGRVYWVKKSTDTDYPEFVAQHPAYEDAQAAVYTTVQAAVDAVTDARNDVVFASPGFYDETLTISTSKDNLTIIGLGGRGATGLQTTTAGAEGCAVSANDVTFINFGIEAEDAADYALRVFGARFRAHGCKFEGPTADVVRVGPQTVAGGAASGVLTGADALFEDCEFAWGGSGIVITSSDYGACTELVMRDCRFHNLTVACIGENDAGAVGAGLGVLIVRPIFQVGSDGVAPTDWIDLNSVGSTGLITGASFEDDTLDSATVQLAAGVRIVDWHTEAEGAPSTGGTSGRPD